MVDIKIIGAFLARPARLSMYFISECIEKDYALKPLVFAVVCATAISIGMKVTYQSTELVKGITKCVQHYSKPGLKVLVNRRRAGGGQLPPPL